MGQSIHQELPPRLMVGVQTIDDLEAAIRGGADMVEISLMGSGRGLTTVLSELRPLVDFAALRAPGVGICLSLGELLEFEGDYSQVTIPAAVRWVRWGLAGCSQRPDWQVLWQSLRHQLEAASGRSLRCLATTYVDPLSGAPKWTDVLAAAQATQCAGLYVDTFMKGEPGIVDCLAPEEMTRLLRVARERQVPLFIAGGLMPDDLDWLCPLEPDVIGVRRAVCDSEDDTLSIDESLVGAFKLALETAADFTALPQTSQQLSRAAVAT